MEGGFLDAERLAAERRRGVWRGRVLTDYLDEQVATRPDDTALIAFREDERSTTRLTYRELASRAARVARVLHRLGVRRGDVVSFQLPNWWEFFAVHLACVRLGAASNPLMPIFRHHELAFMLRHAESKVFIAPARFRGFDHGALALQLARELPHLEHVLLVGGTGEQSFETSVAGADGDAFEKGAALEPDDVVQLLYTSGTTGEPKGVMHTSNTMIGTILAFACSTATGGALVLVTLRRTGARMAGR